MPRRSSRLKKKADNYNPSFQTDLDKAKQASLQEQQKMEQKDRVEDVMSDEDLTETDEEMYKSTKEKDIVSKFVRLKQKLGITKKTIALTKNVKQKIRQTKIKDNVAPREDYNFMLDLLMLPHYRGYKYRADRC